MSNDPNDKKSAITEQWWAGIVALIALAAVVLILLTPTCQGREVTVRWRANPVSEEVVGYRVWRGDTVLADVATTSATVEAETGDVLTLTAYSMFKESPKSIPYLVPPPTPPDKVVRVSVETSHDMKAWATLIQFDLDRERASFFRLKIELLETP